MADDIFKKVIRELETEVDRAIKTALETTVVPEAKARCPEDDSAPHVRDRIHVEQEVEGTYVVAGDRQAWWGHLIEFGTAPRRTRDRPERQGHSTGTMPPHPFLVPALEANREAIVKAVDAAIKKVSA